MNRDEIKGKINRAKGSAKEKAGELTDNPDLEAEGKVEQAGGQLREGFGTAKRKAGEAIDDFVEDDDE